MNLIDISQRDKTGEVGLHIVKRWRNISHHRHEEEWDLQHIFRNEIEAIDNSIVPCSMLKIENER
jgi:hypothetical protein